MSDAQVVFEIGADDSKAMSSIDSVTDALKKAGNSWEHDAGQSASSIGDKFTSMFKTISIAAVGAKVGQALLQFGKDAIQTASDLQEVQNVVDNTFGASANEIDAWAKNAQTQFGLTELQAKKFTSTLGAMMKSAGLAGPEIVSMSEDLSGLAADMASFYNLDFETAFQKIRAGITGQTMPLKELGINMSEANLQAFALTQGITKAYSAMSQSEQIQLRYQYLMQATADAQGDFSRTSDGYANSLRRIETAMDSIKATAGNVLLPIIGEVTTSIAGLLESLTVPQGTTTVMDEFERIDIDTADKLKGITDTAEQARTLLSVLQEISGYQVQTPASNSLVEFVESFAGRLTGLDTAMEKAKQGDYAGTISALAQALSTEVGGDPQTWENLLKAIGGNAAAAISAVSGDSGQTKAFLESVAAGADDLTTDYSAYWYNLLTVLGDNAGTAITALTNGNTAGTILQALAGGANLLQADSISTWESLLSTLEKVDGLNNIFSSGAGGNVRDLAAALSGASPDTTKAEAWQTFLDALGSNAGALTTLTGTSAEETSAWLKSIAQAANTLDSDDAEGWNQLLSNFVGGLPGLEDTEYGQQFFDTMALNLLALGNESEAAKAGLAALGWSTEDIDSQQGKWLETCKRLVQTIPGLSSVINTETGAVEGGISSIAEYVNAWEEGQKKIALLQAVAEKRAALNAKYSQLPGLEVDAMLARRYAQEAYDAMYEGYLKAFENDPRMQGQSLSSLRYGGFVDLGFVEDQSAFNTAYDNWVKLDREAAAAEEAFNDQKTAYDRASQVLEDSIAIIEETYGETVNLADAAEDAAEEMTTLGKAANGDEEALADVTQALTDAADAFKLVADYAEQVRQDTQTSVNNVVNGFSEIVTPAQKARNQLADVTAEIERLNAAGEDTKTLQGTQQGLQASIPTVQNMTKALQSQLTYMQDYQKYLAEARAMGVDEGLLASLSDGSQESFDYLYALATTGGDVAALNEMWRAVQGEKEQFTGVLTDQKLEADTVFQSLVDSASTAIEGLSLGEEAQAAMTDTVQGIVDGLANNKAAVTEQVDAILNEISRLTSFGGFSLTGSGISFLGSFLNGSHADGLDYVPFDNYLARLHEGEGILTAEENKVWRDFKYGAQNSAIDYGAIGASVWDNAPSGGGNVYLDGVTVGRVISARQGDAYRALERSGWRQ